VLVLMSPRREGRTTLLVQLQDGTGEPVVTDRAPDVQLRTSGLDLGSVPVTSTDAGTWAADVLLPRPGTWEVQVGLRLNRFENPVTTVQFDVAPR
jgi:copper transport protein